MIDDADHPRASSSPSSTTSADFGSRSRAWETSTTRCCRRWPRRSGSSNLWIPSPTSPSDPTRSSSAHQGEIRFEAGDFEYKTGRPALRGVDLHVSRGRRCARRGDRIGKDDDRQPALPLLRCDDGAGDDRRTRRQGCDAGLAEVADQHRLARHVSLLGDASPTTFVSVSPTRRWRKCGRLAGPWAPTCLSKSCPTGTRPIVSERGSGLSLGQRQLVSFARALLADPRILILDEATASVDTETELHIQQALERLLARAARRSSSPTASRPSATPT